MKNFIYSRIISFFPDYRQKSQKSCPAESPAQELLRLEHLIILLTAEQNLNKVVTMGETYKRSLWSFRTWSFMLRGTGIHSLQSSYQSNKN